MSNNYSGTSFGCIPSGSDMRDYRLPSVPMSLTLPDEYEVLHSPIKNQEQVCSCVAHSVCEVVEAIEKNTNRYSTNWIYGYRPFGYLQGKGMMTRNALSTAVKVGCVLYEDFAGNEEVPKVKDIVNANLDMLKEKASSHKMYSYAKLRSRKEIKEAIYLSKSPVVVCLHCCDPFETDENNILIYSDKFRGYHAMVCYGWNKYGLLLQNSWGESWADGGTCILPDEYPLLEAWLLTDNSSSFAAVKPKLYWFRKMIQSIKSFFTTVFNKSDL